MRLLQTAIELIAKRGFQGVSVDEIAIAAHLSKLLQYHHFGSKGGLVRDALMANRRHGISRCRLARAALGNAFHKNFLPWR